MRVPCVCLGTFPASLLHFSIGFKTINYGTPESEKGRPLLEFISSVKFTNASDGIIAKGRNLLSLRTRDGFGDSGAVFLRLSLGPVGVRAGRNRGPERGPGISAKSLRGSPVILEVISIFPLDLEPVGPEDGR